MIGYYILHGLWSLLLFAPVVYASHRLARFLFPENDPLKRFIVAALFVFAIAVAAGGILGATGYLGLIGYLVVLWILAPIVHLGTRKKGAAAAVISENVATPDTAGVVVVFGLVGITLLAGALAARLAQPTAEWDELTYHLHFPAQWLAAGRISIIDTPFGDAAPAYAPANGELWFAFLMAPMAGRVPDPVLFKLTGVDAWARIGQFPFFCLLAASVVLIARGLGADRRMRALPAVLLPFIPLVLRQASNAYVDVMTAGCFIGALAFLEEYRKSGNRTDVALAALALGLAAGVKFVIVVYAVLIVVPAFLVMLRRGDKRSMALFASIAAIVGSPWYLRNYMVTGNPLFPLQTAFGEHVLFPGAYSRSAMLRSVFHVGSLGKAWPFIVEMGGPYLTPVLLGGLIAGIALSIRRREWRGVGWLPAAALLMHFAVVPYNTQVRFLVWAAALALMPLALWPARRIFQGMLGLLLTAPVALALIGPGESFRIGPIFFPGGGMLNRTGLSLAVLVLGAVFLAWSLLRRMKTVKAASTACVLLAVSVSFALIPAKGATGVYYRTSLSVLRYLPLDALDFLFRAKPRSVAYSGGNGPYYFGGREGLTRAQYVNIDGRETGRLHDYVHELRADGRLDLSKEKDAWQRQHPDFDAWRKALDRLRVQ